MSVPVESDETPNSVLQGSVYSTVEDNQNRLAVLEKAARLQTNGLIVQTVTNGDSTHVPSGDAVFDALLAILASVVVNGDTTHAPTGDAVNDYVDGRILSTTASLNFGLIGAGSVGVQTVTLTGAVANDAVMLGPPAALESGLISAGRVSASDTISIRLFNGTAAGIDPVAATWRVTVIR